MISLITVNTLIIIGIVICVIIAAVVENTFASIISMSAAGLLMAIKFLLLHAPGAAAAEATVGAILIPAIFFTAIKKVEEGKEN